MDVTRREVRDGDHVLHADMKKRAVRIHHPTLKNCVYTMVAYSIRYQIPHDCPMCNVGHIFKTYHLLLNENGDVTVAMEIYENWKKEGLLNEMKGVKEVVPRPWVLRLDPLDGPNGPQPPVVVSREDGLVKAPNEKVNVASPERIISG